MTHDLEEAIALSIEWLLCRRGPRRISLVTGAFPSNGRGYEVKLDPVFHELHRDIWHKLNRRC